MSEPAANALPAVPRWLTYGAVAVITVYLGFMFAATDGHFVPQVADLYVVCQYARAIAEGHPFQYNAGEPASTGSTSLLFTVVLGAADALGIRGEGLVAFAILSGAVSYVLAIHLACRLAGRLASGREAVLAGALVLLSGPVVWAFLYGSDIAVFLLLFLWLTERLCAGSWPGVAAVGTLLALARPEGLAIGLVLAVAAPHLWPRGRRLLWLGAPLAAGIAVLVLFRMLTGHWVNTSMADKSLLASYGVQDTLALVTEYLVDVVRGILLGLYPAGASIGFAKGWAPYYFAPFALVLVIVGAVGASSTHRAPIRTWAAIVGLLFLLVSPNMFMGVHFNRYILWAFPTFHVLTAVGLQKLTRRLAAHDDALERRLFRGGAAFLLAFGLLATTRFAGVYGDQAGEVYRRDVAAAHWISRHLSRGAVIANLATSVEYLTGHRNVNLHGVTAPAFFGGKTAEREMGVFEMLGRLDPAQRPEYLMTTVNTHESLPSMQELVALPPLYQTSSFGDEIVIYRMRYDAVGKNRRLHSAAAMERVRGRRLVDEVNVGDPRSEDEHDYSFLSRTGSLRLHGTVRSARYASGESVIDGGRAIFGGESFLVEAERGKDLLVVVRTAPAIDVAVRRASGTGVFAVELPEATVALWVEGRPYQQIHLQPQGGWDEHVFRIDSGSLGPGRTHIELQGRYVSFYYWFFQ